MKEEILSVEFDENAFFIPPNEHGMALCGHKLKCNKCKRKILIQLPLIGVPHHTDAFAVCGECLEIDENFEKLFPELAKNLKEWKEQS